MYDKRDELVVHCAFDVVLAAETAAALEIVALDWWLIIVQYLRRSGVSHDRRVCLRCDVWPLKGPKLNRVRLWLYLIKLDVFVLLDQLLIWVFEYHYNFDRNF